MYFVAENAGRLTSNVVQVRVREKAQLSKSETALPSSSWQDQQVKDFSAVRMRLARHISYMRSQGGSSEKPTHKLPSKNNEQGKIY